MYLLTRIIRASTGDVGVLARDIKCSTSQGCLSSPLLCHCRLRGIAGEDAHVPYFVLRLMKARVMSIITVPKMREITALLVNPATRNVKNDTVAAVRA